MRIGADLHENRLFMKSAVLGLFCSFLDLLDLKNGSGSKFYAGKWYREVWKPKINAFRVKTINFWCQLDRDPHFLSSGKIWGAPRRDPHFFSARFFLRGGLVFLTPETKFLIKN